MLNIVRQIPTSFNGYFCLWKEIRQRLEAYTAFFLSRAIQPQNFRTKRQLQADSSRCRVTLRYGRLPAYPAPLPRRRPPAGSQYPRRGATRDGGRRDASASGARGNHGRLHGNRQRPLHCFDQCSLTRPPRVSTPWSRARSFTRKPGFPPCFERKPRREISPLSPYRYRCLLFILFCTPDCSAFLFLSFSRSFPDLLLLCLKFRGASDVV